MRDRIATARTSELEDRRLNIRVGHTLAVAVTDFFIPNLQRLGSEHHKLPRTQRNRLTALSSSRQPFRTATPERDALRSKRVATHITPTHSSYCTYPIE